MPKLLKNVMIYDFDDFIRDGYILFEDKIIDAGRMQDVPDGIFEEIDGSGQLALPGLVSAHTHLYSAFARGLALKLDIRSFKDILTQLWWKLDRGIDNDIAYASALSFGSEMLLNGVTSISDHHASGREIAGSLEAIKKAVTEDLGMRGIFAFETSDRFDVDEAIRENRDFISHNTGPYASGTFGMHASMSLSDDTLAKVKANLDDAPIHIHVAESLDDETDCRKKHHVPIVKRLDNFRLLTPDSILSHGVHLDQEEMDIIREKDVLVCLNVSSNMNNGVGLPDVRKMKESGIRTILGNDGLHAGMAPEYLNLYYTMHLKYASLTGFSDVLVKEAINETYDYFTRRLSIGLGKFRKGYAADFLTLPYIPATPIDKGNAMSHMLFGVFPGFKPKDVYVAGQRKVAGYELVFGRKDMPVLARNAADRLWKNIAEEEE